MLVTAQESHPDDEATYRGLVTFVPLHGLRAAIERALAQPDSAALAAQRAAAFRERFQARAIFARAALPRGGPPEPEVAAAGRGSAAARGDESPAAPRGRPAKPFAHAHALPPPAQARSTACRPGSSCCLRHPRVPACSTVSS